MTAACTAAPRAWTPSVEWKKSPLRVAAGAAIMGLVAVHVVATIWPGRAFGGDVHPTRADVLPLVAALEQHSQPMSRVLVMWQGDDGVVRYSVEGSDGVTALAGRARPDSNDVGSTTSRTEDEGSDVVVRGEFVSVDTGSRSMRMLVGFGAGRAELSTLVETFQITPSGP